LEPFQPAITHTWSLEEVIDHLRHQQQIEAVLCIGSLANNSLTHASDYDLVIVKSGMPQAWYVGVTSIGGRFTDLLFVSPETVEAVATLHAPVSHLHELAPVLSWLKNGRILFDNSGRIAQAQAALQKLDLLLPPEPREAYGAWFGMNFNLAVAQRLSSTQDPLYQTTARIRMAVYGPPDLWFGYFTVRAIAWDGDKSAVRYLMAHDPVFLQTFEAFISAVEPAQKLSLYRQATRLAAAPLGGVWPESITVMNIAGTLLDWQMLFG
jgi:hypothetical protein